MNQNAVEHTSVISIQRLSPADAMEAGPDQSAIHAIVRPFDAVTYVYFGLETFGLEQRETRWRGLVAQLERAGAPAAAIAALTERVEAAKEAPGTLSIFGSGDGTLLHEQHLAAAAAADRAGYSAPADVMALLAYEQQRPPHVLVVVDRAGADLTACAGADRPPRTWHIKGADDEIERNSPGGWSQPRYQRRAEDSWKHNSGQVAEAAVAALSKVGGQVLVLTGDVRAVQFLTEQLPSDLPALVCHITGSRSMDGSQSGRKHQVEQSLREAATAQTRALLEHLQANLGLGGLGVEGRDATLEALAAGRVATLLVTDPVAEGSPAWFGAGPTEIYPDHGAAMLSGVPVRSGRLADVAARSVLLAGGRVRVIPAGTPDAPLEGIGGICRFAL